MWNARGKKIRNETLDAAGEESRGGEMVPVWCDLGRKTKLMKMSRSLLLEKLLLWLPYKIFSRICISKILHVARISLTDVKKYNSVSEMVQVKHWEMWMKTATLHTCKQVGWKEWKQHSEYNLCSILNIQRIFSGPLDGNKSTCKAGDPGLIPGWEWSPGEKNCYPLQYSCLEIPMNKEA